MLFTSCDCGHIEADLLHGIFEEQPVFRLFDGVDFGADQFHAIFFENTRFRQFHRKVQGGLAADCGEQRRRGAPCGSLPSR